MPKLRFKAKETRVRIKKQYLLGRGTKRFEKHASITLNDFIHKTARSLNTCKYGKKACEDRGKRSSSIFSVLILTLAVFAESPLIEQISYLYIRRKVTSSKGRKNIRVLKIFEPFRRIHGSAKLEITFHQPKSQKVYLQYLI